MATAACSLGLAANIPAKADGLSDAKSMVAGIVDAIEKAGWPGALNASPAENWVRIEDDLYIFILNIDGIVVFHPDSGAIGVNVSEARDINGNPYIQNLLNQLNNDGNTGVVEYFWPRPTDGKVRLKRTFAQRTGTLIVACGVYVEDI